MRVGGWVRGGTAFVWGWVVGGGSPHPPPPPHTHIHTSPPTHLQAPHCRTTCPSFMPWSPSAALTPWARSPSLSACEPAAGAAACWCWCCCLLVPAAGACCWCCCLPQAASLRCPPPPPSPRRPPRPPLTPSPPPLGAGLRSADRARQGPGGQARGGGAGGGALQVRGAGVVACEFCACGGGGECVGQSPRRWSLSTCAPPHVPTQGAGAAGGLVRAAAHRRDQRALSPPPPPLRRLLPPLPRAAARVQRRWVWGGWVGRGDGWVDGWVG